MMRYTENYNLKKPEELDPVDIQDLNYNADVIDGKLKEIEDWEAAHLQASNPHSITPALIGAETPTGAQQKANQAETNAKSYADTAANSALSSAKDYANIVTNNALNSAKSYADTVAKSTLNSAKNYADTAANNALNSAKDYTDTVAKSTLNSAQDYADDVLESANSHTDQVASDLTQKLNETRIKVLDVEQDVSNISKVLTNLNPNQEAKQSVSGYGILSLPKNAANGQVSVSVKGMTLKNELNYNRDTWEEWILAGGSSVSNGNLVVGIGTSGNTRLPSNFKPNTKYGVILTKVNSTLSSLSISTASAFPTIHSIIPATALTGNFKFVITSKAEITNNSFNMFSGTNSEAPMEIKDIRVFELPADSEIENDFDTMTADQLAQKYPYIKGDSIKSTVSAIRLKSVGKNIWGSKKAADDVVQIINNSNYAYLTNIDGRNCLALVGHNLIRNKDIFNKFKPNTQYTIQVYAKRGDSSYNGGLLRIKYTDGSVVLVSPASDVWSKLIYTSVPGKTIESIQLSFGTSGRTNYFDYDTLQIEEGNQATEYEPYKESVAYITAKDELGNILELRSLPNGTKDEIRVSGGKAELVKRVSNEYTINSDLIQGVSTRYYQEKATSFTLTLNIDNTVPSGTTLINDNAYIVQNGIKFSPQAAWGPSTIYWDKDFPQYYIFPNLHDGRMRLVVSLPHTMTGWEGSPTVQQVRDYFDANPAALTYQLAEPVEIPIEVSGNIVSYPSGTIYIERAVPDVGIYTDKMTVLHQDLPIKALEKISKVDFATGLETELDVSDAVIAEDKLSFTHPDLVDGDIVFFTYEYDRESTEGETEIEYYDSRYVIQDSVTGKFYKWKIAVANGTPTIELEEV